MSPAQKKKERVAVAYRSAHTIGTLGGFMRIGELLAGIRPEHMYQRRNMHDMLVHILMSSERGTRFKTTGDRAVPIPRDIVRKFGGPVTWRLLCFEYGFIGFVDYTPPTEDGKPGRCREYFLAHKFADAYYGRHRDPVKEGILVNLYTGRPTRRQVRSKLLGADRRPVPAAPMIKAVCSYPNEVDMPAMEAMLESERVKAIASGRLGDLARLRQMQGAMETLRTQCRGSGSYEMAFVQRGPRIYEVGGIQGIANNLKYAAYKKAIEKKLVKNFDQDTCHPRMVRFLAAGINSRTGNLMRMCRMERMRRGIADLRDFGGKGAAQAILMKTFEDSGCDLTKVIFPLIPCSGAMKDYCTKPEVKAKVHADLEAIGVPARRTKALVTSIFYGLGDKGLKEMHPDRDQIKAVRERLSWAFDTARLIHLHLEMQVIDCARRKDPRSLAMPSRPGGDVRGQASGMYRVGWSSRHGVFLVGANGDALKVADTKGEFVKAGDGETIGGVAMLCHILQGCETALWSHVVLSQEAHGYRVLNPQHDGAVIDVSKGQVPAEVFLEAIKRAGLGVGKVHRWKGEHRPDAYGNDACLIREKPFEFKEKMRPPARTELPNGLRVRKEDPPASARNGSRRYDFVDFE